MILGGVGRGNLGKEHKRGITRYEKRLQNNDAFLRENDKTRIRVVEKSNIYGDVRLSFEYSSGEISEKIFTPYMPLCLRAFHNI